MANFAKIVIQWEGVSELDSGFQIRIEKITPVLFPWISKVVRANSFEFEKSEVNAIDQAGFAFDAISADVANSGVSGFMNVTRSSSDEVTIEANEYGWIIDVDNEYGISRATITVVTEVNPTKNFQLTGYALSQAANACNDIRLTMSENDGVAPFIWVAPANPSTTLIADVARQATEQSITVYLRDADGDESGITGVFIPPLFNSSFISSISIVTNAGGLDATVTVFMTNPNNIFNYTYSIDGVTFQSSSIFPNVVDGSYTAYINDGFGCLTTQIFNVDTSTDIARANPFHFVSKANSFRYVHRTLYQYQTLENTLYHNYKYLGEYKPFFAMPYNKTDGKIITQFKSRYDSLSAKVINCEDVLKTTQGAVQTETIIKKSDNIGQRDKRDCIAFNRGSNQSGLYFTTGNIYDPVTDAIIDTYTLNGQLPDWAVVGNAVILTGIVTGSFIIKQVIFDSELNANAVIFDYPWQDVNQSGGAIADVTYDRQPYEVYEFETDLSLLASGVYGIQIIMEDSLNEWTDVVYDSEYFIVDNDHDHTNFIEYYDSPNTGIDYSTGFIGRVRVRSLDAYSNLTPGGEVTAYKNSLSNLTKLKDVPTMEGVFYMEQQPRYMIEKLRIIFAHEHYFINGEEWQNEEAIEVENFAKSALKNANITISRVDYDLNKIDNIKIDADTGFILTEKGKLLQ